MRRENYYDKLKFVLIQPGPINTSIKQNSLKHFERWLDWKNSTHKKTYENKILKRLYLKKQKR